MTFHFAFKSEEGSTAFDLPAEVYEAEEWLEAWLRTGEEFDTWPEEYSREGGRDINSVDELRHELEHICRWVKEYD